jgi:hypothetical protein
LAPNLIAGRCKLLLDLQQFSLVRRVLGHPIERSIDASSLHIRSNCSTASTIRCLTIQFNLPAFSVCRHRSGCKPKSGAGVVKADCFLGAPVSRRLRLL